MKLRNLSLSALLALSFAAIVLVMLVIGAINLSSLSTINNATDKNDHSFKVLATGEAMQINALNIETGSRGYLLSGDKSHIQSFEPSRETFEKKVRRSREAHRRQPQPAGASGTVGEIVQTTHRG